MTEKNIEKSLVSSLKSDNLTNMVVDGLELATDAMLDEGIAKDIPIFGTLVNVYKASTSIKERLFARKIYKFLAELSKISHDKRQAMMDEIAAKKGGIDSAGASILDLVEKLDDEEKPALIGKLFVACSNGDISLDQLFRLSNAISKIYIDQIRLLSNVRALDGADVATKNAFLANGLMTISVKNPDNLQVGGIGLKDLAAAIYDQPIGLSYKLTGDAKLIAEICFDSDFSRPDFEDNITY